MKMLTEEKLKALIDKAFWAGVAVGSEIDLTSEKTVQKKLKELKQNLVTESEEWP